MDGCDSTSGVSQASIFFKTMSHFLYMQFIRMSIRMSSHRRIIFIHHLMCQIKSYHVELRPRAGL
ncbi:Hypothetical predicted protein [Podarcis lilfordi]|uniref:Uncharacterized protein n=1 Tax=Podarcis lilfordi TaxID=74358 RepID=A0AA35K4G6_9SAUR|nr:Hypothetical predicted protein [Podarcis lilfordi]